MKCKTITGLIFCISLLFLLACGETGTEKTKASGEAVVAIINYNKIYLPQLLDELNRFSYRYGISFPENKEQYRKLARQVLDELIMKLIYFQEAERLQIAIQKNELKEHLQHVLGDYSEEDLTRAFEIRNLDYSNWEIQIEEELLIEKLITHEVKNKIKIEEQEIRAYYKNHSKDYILPERVQALQIVVNNELEAEAIYNDLQEGADFFELAKSKSVSPESIYGGDLGFFSRGQMPQEFDDAVFNLKTGEFSKVVYTPYGYHIFKVIKKKRVELMSFKDAKEKIKGKLLKSKEKEKFLKWVKELKERSVIVIKKNILSSI